MFRRGNYSSFNVIFSLLTERDSFQTYTKLSVLGQRTRLGSVHDELPGELLIRGRSYFFEVGAERREGELFKEIRHLIPPHTVISLLPIAII